MRLGWEFGYEVPGRPVLQHVKILIVPWNWYIGFLSFPISEVEVSQHDARDILDMNCFKTDGMARDSQSAQSVTVRSV